VIYGRFHAIPPAHILDHQGRPAGDLNEMPNPACQTSRTEKQKPLCNDMLVEMAPSNHQHFINESTGWRIFF